MQPPGQDSGSRHAIKGQNSASLENVCFYLSGVDILTTDQFGKLNISMAGCKQRDVFVLQTMFNNKIPVVVAMGGGYSKDIKLIVEAHCNTFKMAQEIFY
jgi:acetoin utilization deacetylase AcuC-like enzyme